MVKKPEVNWELWDIFDSFRFTNGKWKGKFETIEKNIIYILKRERLWKSGMSICFPCGSMDKVDIDNDDYQFDFEIFRGSNNLIASGTCYGSLMVLNESEGDVDIEYYECEVEILDMNLEICEGIENLKRGCEKEVVNFT